MPNGGCEARIFAMGLLHRRQALMNVLGRKSNHGASQSAGWPWTLASFARSNVRSCRARTLRWGVIVRLAYRPLLPLHSIQASTKPPRPNSGFTGTLDPGSAVNLRPHECLVSSPARRENAPGGFRRFPARCGLGGRALQPGFPETLHSTPTRRSYYGRENFTVSRPRTG